MTERPESYESAKAICENYDGFPAIIDTIPEKVRFIGIISELIKRVEIETFASLIAIFEHIIWSPNKQSLVRFEI